jgi:hypothetical protein
MLPQRTKNNGDYPWDKRSPNPDSREHEAEVLVPSPWRPARRIVASYALQTPQYRFYRISEERDGIILTVGLWRTASSPCPFTKWINPKRVDVFLNGWRVQAIRILLHPLCRSSMKCRPYWKVFRVIRREMHYSYWFYVTINGSPLQRFSIHL